MLHGRVSKEEVSKITEEQINDRIEKIYNDAKEKEWYTARELGKLINISHTKINKWVLVKDLPFKYMGSDKIKALKEPSNNSITRWIGPSESIKEWLLKNKDEVAIIIAREIK